ncbi:hypothetical protein BD413DRAFT_486835, partial [Trametes elegans]
VYRTPRPAGDPVNIRGTPNEFEHCEPEPSALIEHPNEITQHEVRSQGVHSLSLEGSGAVSIASSAVESGSRYMCTEHSSAMLMLKHPAHSTRLTCSVRIREYLRRHLANWRAFATDTLGIDLQESDLIFVSGTDKTLMWAEAAFSSKTSHGELHISGDVFASPISGTFSASLSKC